MRKSKSKLTIQRGYKIKLRPNNRQKTLLAQAVGTARFTYNWGLNQRIELYKTEKKSTTAISQHKLLNSLKKSEFPWMYEVTKCAPQEALTNLQDAFERFFKNIKEGKKPGFPRFKKKHDSHQSFKVTTGAIYVTKTSIKIPNIPAPIRFYEKGYIPTKNVKYCFYTISRDSGEWFLSVNCEVQIPKPKRTPKRITGVDLGIKNLAVCSDGSIYPNIKSLSKLERRLSRAQRERCRRKKGSAGRLKSIRELQRLHVRVRNKRSDSLHKTTTDLVKTKPGLFVLEDLSVKGMVKNPKLSKSISDASFGEFKRQMAYKSGWYGSEILEADRWLPSSKLCSGCGSIKEELSLSDRVYRCTECGLEIDRDLNASLNLKRYGEFRRSLSKQKACGEEGLQSRELCEKFLRWCSSKKQEGNRKSGLG